MDGGEALAVRLRQGKLSRDLSVAGPDSVSVYPQHFQSLDEAGVLELLEDSIAVLTNLSLYSQETGLSLQIKTGNVSRSYGKKLLFGKSCDIIPVRSLEGRPFRKGRVLFYVS